MVFYFYLFLFYNESHCRAFCTLADIGKHSLLLWVLVIEIKSTNIYKGLLCPTILGIEGTATNKAFAYLVHGDDIPVRRGTQTKQIAC